MRRHSGTRDSANPESITTIGVWIPGLRIQVGYCRPGQWYCRTRV